MTRINRRKISRSGESPADTVARIAAGADRLTTPCGAGGMVWHRWAAGAPDGRPPLVLLHGGFGSWTHWIANVEALSARRDVIAADLPGLGDSADVPEPHTTDGLAGIVSAGLDIVVSEGTPFHLAGFSFGGLLGAVAAARQGERCLTFTAVGASGFGDMHNPVQGLVVPRADAAPDAVAAAHRNNLKLLMLAHDESIDPLAVHCHAGNVGRGRVKSRRLSVSKGLVDALPDITARIGGIWGELDATAGGRKKIEHRRDLFRRRQPGAPFEIIEDAGHWVMYEAPAKFEAALEEMIEG